MNLRRFLTLLAGYLLLLPVRVSACTVCFGDPNSNQVRGAEAGVLVLLGVIVFLLLAIAGAILFFTIRARRIRQVTNNVNLPTFQ